MSLHTVYFEGELRPGPLTIGGDEAHHAIRVKRLQPGDRVRVLDGQGRTAETPLSNTARDGRGWRLQLDISSVQTVPPIRPRLEVCSPAPKGQRLADLIDGLSQAGAASWSLLETQHSAGEPRPGKLDRLARTAAEASKQCGRAWLLSIGEMMSFDDATTPGATTIILADASGDPYTRSGAESIRLLIGPEGGWSAREIERARSADVRIVRFGPHVMRIETAAVVAAAIVIDAEQRR